VTLLRSRIEYAKRIFLDRLTTDAQPLAQSADIDEGPGDDYVYGGCYDPDNLGIGADCSGAVGIFLAAAHDGEDMSWQRYFSTETYPAGFESRRVSRDDLLTNPYPIKVCIHHGGGGPNSHMNCWIDGWLMESNGSHGTCTTGHGAMPLDSPYWNDWWVIDGPITEDTDWRQPMGYPLGVDYAGGRPAGKALHDAGIVFACRYLSDGGPSLPGKQLLPAEAEDLRGHGISIVSNWETTADRMIAGYDAGRTDATKARDWVAHCGGDPNRPIYFSADWDATPEQQTPINEYLRACGDVLGGPDKVGIYAGYWPLSRALDAGVAKWAWQTEAWSGTNVDARVNIMQRNTLGYKYVDGVQCDVDQAHTVDYGQWGQTAAPAPAPLPVPADPAVLLGDVHWKETFALTLAGRPRHPNESDDQYGHVLSARAEGLFTQAVVVAIADHLGLDAATLYDRVKESLRPQATA
jgi:hypothetical protein